MPERAHEIALPAFEVLAAAVPQAFEVERARFPPRVPARACGRFPCPPATSAAVEVAQVTLAQKRVAQHRAQGRRQRQRQREGHLFARQPVQHRQQGQIRLRDRLVEPVLFQKLRVLRVPDIGQVRVQHQGEVAVFGHGSGRAADEARANLHRRLVRKAQIPPPTKPSGKH